jgi:hypothetical protein
MATPQRQSMAQFERALAEQTLAERQRRDALQREVAARSRQRQMAKAHKHGSLRFALLILVLVATAVLVTVAMFETLYYVMG